MKKLRSVLKSNKPLVIPGVYDAIGAKIVEKVGFNAMFQTGYGTSATLFGMPDYGFIGAAETVDNARRICSAVSAPVIVDSDTGYGNALSVWKLVKELESAGASGIFLEDQRWPKRCGHMQGKEVVSQEEYTEKLGAAIDARENKDFIIVARTDARATEGLDAAIERGIKNKKTGADAIFIEAPRSIEEMRTIAFFAIAAMIIAIPTFYGLYYAESAYERVGYTIILIVVATTGFGPIPAFLSERFPTEVRNSASGFIYNGGLIFGSWAPLIAVTMLSNNTELVPVLLGTNVIIGSMIILIGAKIKPETRDEDLTL